MHVGLRWATPQDRRGGSPTCSLRRPRGGDSVCLVQQKEARVAAPKIGMLFAIVVCWIIFVWQLDTGTSVIAVGLTGLLVGVLTGAAFPSRRQILRETK